MTKDELLQLRRERGKQVLNIGDKVRAISVSGKPLYDGKTATIIEKGMSGNEVYFGLYIEGVTVEKCSSPIVGKSAIIGNTALLAPFFPEDLELVEHAHFINEASKFKEGDRVVATKPCRYYGRGWIGTIKTLCIDTASVKFDRSSTYSVSYQDLAPYAEPTAKENEEKELKHGTITIPVKVDIDDACYEVLRIDLAKETAIAYAEKGRYEPEEIGAKAVEVANGVVERLKKSEQ